MNNNMRQALRSVLQNQASKRAADARKRGSGGGSPDGVPPRPSPGNAFRRHKQVSERIYSSQLENLERVAHTRTLTETQVEWLRRAPVRSERITARWGWPSYRRLMDCARVLDMAGEDRAAYDHYEGALLIALRIEQTRSPDIFLPDCPSVQAPLRRLVRLLALKAVSAEQSGDAGTASRTYHAIHTFYMDYGSRPEALAFLERAWESARVERVALEGRGVAGEQARAWSRQVECEYTAHAFYTQAVENQLIDERLASDLFYQASREFRTAGRMSWAILSLEGAEALTPEPALKDRYFQERQLLLSNLSFESD